MALEISDPGGVDLGIHQYSTPVDIIRLNSSPSRLPPVRAMQGYRTLHKPASVEYYHSLLVVDFSLRIP